MPPHTTATPEKGLLDKIIGSLVTRFDSTPAAIRRILPRNFDMWGKVRILNGGDTIHAASLVKQKGDRRDQTYVRVSATCNIISRYRCRSKHLSNRSNCTHADL